MDEQIEYFFAVLNANLSDAMEPKKALDDAVENYGHVFFPPKEGN